MTTTSNDTDSTPSARIIPFRKLAGTKPADVVRALAKLRPAVKAGDGAAMLLVLEQAQFWCDDFPAVDAPLGGDGDADYLLAGASEIWRLIAAAPARTLPALLAKAQLAELHWVKNRDGWCLWEAELATTMRESVAALVAQQHDAGAPANG